MTLAEELEQEIIDNPSDCRLSGKKLHCSGYTLLFLSDGIVRWMFDGGSGRIYDFSGEESKRLWMAYAEWKPEAA